MTARALFSMACAAALTALAPRAALGSEADAFEHKVKPVSGQLYTKAGKLELSPSLQLSMNDAFFSKYLAGATLAYHLSEYFSVGVTGVYAFANSATGSTTVCTGGTGCREAFARELYQVPGYLKWILGAELGFSPVYGKLNVFAEKAIHFDLSLLVGADLVGYRDVIGAAAAAGGATPPEASTLGGHVGIGARVFLGRSFALGLQIKDVLYSVKGLASGNLQNQLFAQAGLSYFFPLSSREAP